MRHLAILIALASALGCNGNAKHQASDRPAPPVDGWSVTSIDPSNADSAVLWNGFIGLRIKSDGTAEETMFDIAKYESAGEEKILPQADVLAGEWSAGVRGTPLVPTASADYSQTIDFRQGEIRTQWTQDVEGTEVNVQSSSTIDPDFRLVAQKWRFTAEKPISIHFRSVVPESIQPSRTGTENAVTWTQGGDSVAHETFRSNHSGGGEPFMEVSGPRVSISGNTGAGLPFEVEITGDFSPTTSSRPQKWDGSYSSLARRVKSIWEQRWQTDIEIDGPVEDQQAVRSFLFFLRSALHPGTDRSISPFALSSDKYFGHVFWDADIWVFPALALIDPDRARAIAEYRLTRLPQARRNFNSWIAAGRPVANGKMGPLAPIPSGVKFPWESSVSGRETVPGSSQFEDHVTGSVAFGLVQAGALELIDPKLASSVAGEAAEFYLGRSEEGEHGREIHGVMSPDENHIGDNDLYTNCLANWTMQFVGKRSNTFYLPADDQSHLTYDHDALRKYKQAAAVLAIYPLQDPMVEKEARTMIERFGSKVIQNGPAMSDSVHAIIWARLGESERAYNLWKESWEDFTAGSLSQFAEKRNLKDTYFTTGAAGCLQTILFGFLGFRIDLKEQEGAEWSKPLALQRILSVKPNLPKAWKSVKLRNFTVRGRRYTLIATHNGVQVIQGDH